MDRCHIFATIKLLAVIAVVGMSFAPISFAQGEKTTEPPAYYEKLSPSSEIWLDSTFWQGSEWTRVGKNWQHPGQDTPSVRCLTLPKDGKVTIAGRVRKADTAGGDGVRAIIRHGNREVWKAEINGADGEGVETGVTLEVQKGDLLRFIIQKRGDYGYDSTYWDPEVTYADGTRLLASAGFSTKTDCDESVWSYEMENTARVMEDTIREMEKTIRSSGQNVTKAILASEMARKLQNDPALREKPDLAFWEMVCAEWQREDQLCHTAENYQAAATKHLERARQLLADLKRDAEPDFLQTESEQLDRLTQDLAAADKADLQANCDLYYKVRWLKRHITLSNPLMDFGKMLFTKRVPGSYSHLVMQYFGWRARPGGGIFVLDRPGYSLECHDVLEGKLAGGSVLEPRLSFDAKKIVFSFVDNADKQYDPATITNDDKDEGFYHIFEVGVDGSDFRQLTSGSYDDLMPTYLPDGGIAFCSTRRLGYARCFGPQFSKRWDVYTLHRMDSDGKNIRTLSFHDTNEWFPTVDNNGRLIYSRWDYIDRDAVTHQNLWSTRPDGTSPMAVWGNAAPSPHCTFQAKPIPDSQKIIFTAAAHHSITGGSLVILDPSVDLNSQDALQRITPEVPFPEAETGWGNMPEYYESPWPLSENYFLTAYSPVPLIFEGGPPNTANALGIYLLDTFGNRELIYRDPAISSTNPCPLVARPCPPILPSMLPEELLDTSSKDVPSTGEMVLYDVYQGLGDVPRGSIKQLRIVQIFPKTTPLGNDPPVGVGGEENARAILGTVPIEPDGSARFLVPAKTPFLMQALDEDGLAYQTMRSLTYLQPGERISCIGCHEERLNSPVSNPTRNVQALYRPPSEIEPGPSGVEPFSYVRTVQPIWNRHCIECHAGEKPDGGIDLTDIADGYFNRSYNALCGTLNDFWETATNEENAARALVPRFGARNQIQITPPGGAYGARGSRLLKLFHAGHYDVKLTPEEFRQLGTWIDMNAIFYGVNKPEDQARQLRGERVPMPEIQ